MINDNYLSGLFFNAENCQNLPIRPKNTKDVLAEDIEKIFMAFLDSRVHSLFCTNSKSRNFASDWGKELFGHTKQTTRIIIINRNLNVTLHLWRFWAFVAYLNASFRPPEVYTLKIFRISAENFKLYISGENIILDNVTVNKISDASLCSPALWWLSVRDI